MRIAIIQDWLTSMRGGERVLEELCGLYPQSEIFTLFRLSGSVSRRIESMPIHVSPLDRLPGVRERYRDWLPLYPWAISRFDLSGFDLIISNSHAVAKGVRKPAGSLHICNCLTPMRYIWDMGSDYFQYSRGSCLRRTALGVLRRPLRAWDRATAARVDCFVAISRHVQERIARCYGRGSELIYPPVDTGFFTAARDRRDGDYFLVVTALVPYKRVDLAIDACRQANRRLVVVGDGPDRRQLEARAGASAQFRGFVSNEELRELYRGCRAVMVTGREDFGLVSLEAQSCGRPVIAFAGGGSAESVRDGTTGILFGEQSVAATAAALDRFERTKFDPAVLRANADGFSRERFRREMRSLVERRWREFASSGNRTVASDRPRPSGRAEVVAHADGAGEPHPSLKGVAGGIKRTLDVILSFAGLLVLAIPLLVITWIIRRETPGPGLFLQTRLGRGGRPFTMIKIRTMAHGAEEGTGPIWAVADDPRCTPFGARLRRYGIDELPQLWNVLKGDMSLVGPRPERPEFQTVLEARFPGFRHRLAVRGGLTGLAQVRGWRGDTSIGERLRADLSYIREWTLGKDLQILLQTLIRPTGCDRAGAIGEEQEPERAGAGSWSADPSSSRPEVQDAC